MSSSVFVSKSPRTRTKLRRARAAKLSHYFGRFIVDGRDVHLLFVGNNIATVGPESSSHSELKPDELIARMAETTTLRVDAGWSTPPRLFIQHEYDS